MRFVSAHSLYAQCWADATLVPDWRGIGASPAYAVSASTVSHVVKLSVDTNVQAARDPADALDAL